MGADEGFDDDMVEYRPPPALDDRLWRHPAEMARLGAPAPHRAARRSPWALGFVSVIGSAVLAGSLLFAAGGIGDEPQRLGLRPLATLVPGGTGGLGGTGSGIVSIEVDAKADPRSGNGMVLEDGIHVVTSLQLVPPAGAANDPEVGLRLIDENGVSHRGQVVARDALTDLAIIRADGERVRPWSTPTPATLSSGTRVTALGGGRGVGLRSWTNQVRQGEATSRGAHVDLVGVATLEQPMPAMAAGAVATDAAGNFAGIVSIDFHDGATASATSLDAVIVPAERVRRVTRQFLSTGVIAHGWLGIEAPAPSDTALRVALRLGATVEDVVAGSPAGAAGIRAGDVLTRVCGHDVWSIDDVLAQMLRTDPGTRCSIELLRDGEHVQAEAVVGRRDAT